MQSNKNYCLLSQNEIDEIVALAQSDAEQIKGIIEEHPCDPDRAGLTYTSICILKALHFCRIAGQDKEVFDELSDTLWNYTLKH